MISRTRSSTLIPREIHRDRKTRDKPITTPSQRNKPESSSDRPPVVKKINPLCLEGPATHAGLTGRFLFPPPPHQRRKRGESASLRDFLRRPSSCSSASCSSG